MKTLKLYAWTIPWGCLGYLGLGIAWVSVVMLHGYKEALAWWETIGT